MKNIKEYLKTLKKHLSTRNLIEFIVILLPAITTFYLAYNAYDLPGFSTLIKTLILVSILILTILLILLAMKFIIQEQQKFIIPIVIFSLLLTVGISYAGYTLQAVNSTLNDITDEKKLSSASFIMKSDNTFASLSDLEGKSVGIINNENDNEGNIFPKKELEDNNINVDFVLFKDYKSLVTGVVEGTVDSGAVPKSYQSLLESFEELTDILPQLVSFYDYSYKIENTIANDLSVDQVLNEPFSILLMGIDSGIDGEISDKARSDVLIVATVDPTTLQVTMSSIPRDSYVPIACQDWERDKITHANIGGSDLGGTECVIKTVENLFEIELDFYAKVNFAGVVDIVDAVGGVPLVSPLDYGIAAQTSDDQRGTMTNWIPPGEFWADGETALAFARERYRFPNGDIGRTARQQQVIKGVLNRVLSASSITNVYGILDAAGNNFDTNMNSKQILALAEMLFGKISTTKLAEPTFIIDIDSATLKGYDNNHYHYGMQRLLYYYIPYQGSVNDIKTKIHQELNIIPTAVNDKSFYYSVNYPYWGYSINDNDYSSEAKESFEIPDIVPNFVEDWYTYEQVKEWANTRGLTVNVNEIREGNGRYSYDLAHNTVIGQNERAQLLVSNLGSITIDVLKHNLDCSLSENQVYEECKDMIINFYGMKYNDVKKFTDSYGLNLKVKEINSEDSGYDASKAGTAVNQNHAAYKVKATSVSEIEVTFMAYPTVVIGDYSGYVYDTATNSPNDLDVWMTNNGINNFEIISEYSETIAKNSFISINYLMGERVETSNKFIFTISKGPEPTATIPDFTGQTKENVEIWVNTNALTKVTYSEIESNLAAGQVISVNPGTGTVIKLYTPVTATISLGDINPPVISVDTSDVTITKGDAYSVPTPENGGATASDVVDGNLNVTVTYQVEAMQIVTTTDHFDSNAVGVWTITYSATETSGALRTTTVSKKITVQEPPAESAPSEGESTPSDGS